MPKLIISAVSLCFWSFSAITVQAAEPDLLVARIVDRVPRTVDEVRQAHEKSTFSCVELPADSPLAETTFAQRVFYDVALPLDGRQVERSLLYDWGHWPALSYGTSMNANDQADLPYLTSGFILDRVNNSYISIQARVHRTDPDGAPYLHYIPVAGVGRRGKNAKTEAFVPLQQSAVKDVRGLGLFLTADEPRRAESLRTLVIAHRGSSILPNKQSKEIQTAPTYELMFIRLRMSVNGSDESPAEAVELHTFGTTDGLTRLVYFAPYAPPKNAEECSLTGTIRITEYSLGGQNPSARATRFVKFNNRGDFTIEALDAFARQNGWTGDAFDNLTRLLDAIIDGHIRGEP